MVVTQKPLDNKTPLYCAHIYDRLFFKAYNNTRTRKVAVFYPANSIYRKARYRYSETSRTLPTTQEREIKTPEKRNGKT
jgi:hypothetical protein